MAHAFITDDEATARLLFMIQLEADAARRIDREAARLRAAHGLRGGGVRADRLHFTLHHLGDYPWLPAHVVEKACLAGEMIERRPFDVVLDRIGAYRLAGKALDMVAVQGDHGVIGLTEFQRALGAAMNRAGLPHLVKRRFNPHVTVIYDGRHVPEQAIEPIRFRVDRFSLVHSRLGHTEHEVLATWRL